jgi:hypothetical protein
MLHALLHRKLDESIPEPQRLEDALTSTVFGTLVWVDAWNMLARWLLPASASTGGLAAADCACWFWPRLAFAEPDVVLRLGNVLVVVEAKYRSGRHDRMALSEEAELTLCDQLELQYRCITTPRDRRRPYSEPLERAIRECALIQAFIVDRSRMRRATSELAESRLLLPNATVNLVTWQDLFRLLNHSSTEPARWSTDLLSYLQIIGLDTFAGISSPTAPSVMLGWIPRWRAQSARSGLRHAVAPLREQSLENLRRWHAGGGQEKQR